MVCRKRKKCRILQQASIFVLNIISEQKFSYHLKIICLQNYFSKKRPNYPHQIRLWLFNKVTSINGRRCGVRLKLSKWPIIEKCWEIHHLHWTENLRQMVLLASTVSNITNRRAHENVHTQTELLNARRMACDWSMKLTGYTDAQIRFCERYKREILNFRTRIERGLGTIL